MPAAKVHRLKAPKLKNVRINDAFWSPRLETNRIQTIPCVYDMCRQTGRIDAFRLAPSKPAHIFWDSDVAKWIEAAAYSIQTHPDDKLRHRAAEVIDLIVGAQHPDGYLNTYFTSKEPEARWTNLRDRHELYCAGHLMEAAAAWFEATGEHKFLDAMCRFADHIAGVFGPAKGQKRGYPGHQEIELALVRMYRATGCERYLDLACFFIDERGRQPHYFTIEAEERGDDPSGYEHVDYDYCQAHLPVREQKTAEGHAVRAVYQFCAMADIYAETGDKSLLKACRALWRNVTRRRMYVTGGIGSSKEGERFTFDYDLPNETAYAETCAAIGLVFWAHRMLQIEKSSEYSDIMELALYNGVMSGVSLDGRHFFYVNPLAVHPGGGIESSSHLSPQRQEWFGTSCCPPNIARLLASLGQYAYSQSKNAAFVHLYIGGEAELDLGTRRVRLVQKTSYPWKDSVHITVHPGKPGKFTLALRLPGWCGKPEVRVNGKSVGLSDVVTKGYAKLKREWKKGDKVDLRFPMPPETVRSHPKVRMNTGRIALRRGPLVYCLEETDCGKDLNCLLLDPEKPVKTRWTKNLPGGAVTLHGRAQRTTTKGWDKQLYGAGPPRHRTTSFSAVPYSLWANRGPGEMLVWTRER